MNAEIISNGDEITTGKVLDSNSRWLSRELMELGIRVLYHTTVGDDHDAMLNVLRVASKRADLIIWTGGLGPTADDLTRQTIAEFANVPLELNDESMKHIRELFDRRGYEMPESNEIQAYQPQNSIPIFNPQGTAPGIDLIVNIEPNESKSTTLSFEQAIKIGFKNCVRIMAFPGVPAELYQMWNNSVKELIREMLQKISGQSRVIKSRTINCFDAGESLIESMLPDIINRNHIPRVGITATQGTISLRILAESENESECEKLITPVAKLIYDKLSNLIFSEGDDRLQDVVCRNLIRLDKTVSVIESGTRGKLAASIADAKESKKCFRGGIVLPTNTKRTIEVEIEMCRRLFDSDYILSIGSYPDANIIETLNRIGEVGEVGEVGEIGGDSKATNLTVIEIQKNNFPAIIEQESYTFTGHPDIRDELHIKRTLNMFRKKLL